ncbi:MAG TPA: GNAT family N-acetyltransferase, partial [Mycobacteriales bacterium]
AGRLLDAVRAARPPVAEDAPSRIALYLTTPDVMALRAAGVRALPVALPADAWIEIPPGGRDAWLKSLGAHRSRRVRSEARRFEAAGYRVTRHTLAEAYADVARLAFRTEQRYGKATSVDPYLAGFRLQGEFAGDRAEVLLCAYDDGPAVGCCLFYRSGDTVYLRAVGFDYERLRGAAEYATLTYYVPAGFPGVRWLHAGIETPHGKALRGAQLRPLWLLDLSEDSVLVGHEDEINACNAAYRAQLAASSPLVAAAMPPEFWEPFF